MNGTAPKMVGVLLAVVLAMSAWFFIDHLNQFRGFAKETRVSLQAIRSDLAKLLVNK